MSKDLNKPNIDLMKYEGRVYLGGFGEMHMYIMGDKKWIYKPAQDKTGKEIKYRAYIQEACYRLQELVEFKSAQPVHVVAKDGKFGTLQPFIDTRIDSEFFCKWQKEDNVSIERELINQFLREHIVDWLIANFDTYGGNFLVNKQGILIGIDKEQGFKYIKDKETNTIALDYHPNKKYGAIEPIYNTIFKRFINNKIELDLKSTQYYIECVEKISEEEYLKVFENFISNYEDDTTSNISKIILDRKKTLRQKICDFYSEVLTHKFKKEIKFKFEGNRIL